MSNFAQHLSRREAFTLALAPVAIGCVGATDYERANLDDFGKNVGRGDVEVDMDAFARASAWLEEHRGGTIDLRAGAVYLVGRQRLSRGTSDAYSWAPDPIIRCRSGKRPVVINGNGATLKAAGGLRYGAFDPIDGRPLETKAPYFGPFNHRAVPYEGMIDLAGCTGAIVIRNLKLDGSMDTAVLGGEFGDSGRQIPGSGLQLMNNSGPVLIENVDSNNHCWDGMLFRQLTDNIHPDQAPSIAITRFRASRNGRQGISMTGGYNVIMRDCEFRETGVGRIASAPCAGLDIEAEGGQSVRNLVCINCQFVANRGAGLLASGGDARHLFFAGCTFIGAQNYSAWPGHPAMRFADCLFVGPVTGVRAATTANDHISFECCRFTDDRSRSPTGTVYGSAGIGTPFLLDLGEGDVGASVSACTFLAMHDARIVYAKGTSTQFAGCTFREASDKGSWPNGTYGGVNWINSRGAHLTNVKLEVGAQLYLNGKAFQPS